MSKYYHKFTTGLTSVSTVIELKVERVRRWLTDVRFSKRRWSSFGGIVWLASLEFFGAGSVCGADVSIDPVEHPLIESIAGPGSSTSIMGRLGTLDLFLLNFKIRHFWWKDFFQFAFQFLREKVLPDFFDKVAGQR